MRTLKRYGRLAVVSVVALYMLSPCLALAGEYVYPLSGDHVVLYYSVETGLMRTNPLRVDPKYSLTIHGNGYTEVYINSVIKHDKLVKKGNFEMYLPADRISSILDGLESEGLLIFDTVKARREIESIGGGRPKSDSAWVTIKINLDKYRISNHEKEKIITKTIEWDSPGFDTEMYPEAKGVQILVRCVEMLTNIAFELALEAEKTDIRKRQE